MTDQEFKVIQKLVEAHNEFCKLPVQHGHDSAEWTAKIHDLQRVIMVRHTVRSFPEYFVNEIKT